MLRCRPLLCLFSGHNRLNGPVSDNQAVVLTDFAAGDYWHNPAWVKYQVGGLVRRVLQHLSSITVGLAGGVIPAIMMALRPLNLISLPLGQ